MKAIPDNHVVFADDPAIRRLSVAGNEIRFAIRNATAPTSLDRFKALRERSAAQEQVWMMVLVVVAL